MFRGDHLLKEGICSERVFLVGDTMYESIQNHMDDVDNDDVVERLGLDEPFAVVNYPPLKGWAS